MPNFAGLRGTGSFGTDERPKSFREMILWMNPNGTAPLFAMTSKAKTESVDDPEFSWWEEILDICRLTVNGALDGVVTTVVVAAGALQLNPGDILQVEPAVQVVGYLGEFIRVVSVSSDTTFVVTRGAAGSTAAAIGTGLFLTRVGNAQSEGNRSIQSNSSNPVKFLNYTQIWKTPFQITNTAKATKFRTGDPLANDKKRKTFIHSEKIEQALFWGKPSEVADATNGNLPLRTTMGLRHFITSNRTVFAATITMDAFMDAINPVFNYESGGSGNERIVYAGNGALNFLNKLIRTEASTRITYDGTIELYGQRLQKWIMPQGTIAVKSHPLMNVHPVYQYSMFVVNPTGVIYRPLRGRDTKIEKNIQENDADYEKDQWITEAGFEFHFERTFAYLGNVKTI